jgi:hypothetical protein
MATGVVSITSDLVRKKWIREGLLQAASKSFWNPYTGMSKESIVYQRNDTNASEGHTVVFDMDGNLAGKAYKGKTTAFGKGEQKKKFSDKITVDRYRIPVDNGDEFDGVNIGDLSITQHSDSRAKLADLFVRWKDQMIFDTAQGAIGTAPTHIIQPGTAGVVTNTWYSELVDIEINLRTGKNMLDSEWDAANNTASSRAPLQPYTMADGRSIWLMIVDPHVAGQMRKDTSMTQLLREADNRGDSNRLIKGLLGRIGALHIVEAEMFFGQNAAGLSFEESEVEIAGLRRYDIDANAWEGTSSFVATNTLWSRSLILGKTALQVAFGKMPDYHYQESEDFGIKSESAVEFWTNCQKINLTAENDDYVAAKRAGLDNGVVVVDCQTQA